METLQISCTPISNTVAATSLSGSFGSCADFFLLLCTTVTEVLRSIKASILQCHMAQAIIGRCKLEVKYVPFHAPKRQPDHGAGGEPPNTAQRDAASANLAKVVSSDKGILTVTLVSCSNLQACASHSCLLVAVSLICRTHPYTSKCSQSHMQQLYRCCTASRINQDEAVACDKALSARLVNNNLGIEKNCAAQAPDGQVDPFVEMTLIDPEREKPEMQVSFLDYLITEGCEMQVSRKAPQPKMEGFLQDIGLLCLFHDISCMLRWLES